MGLWRELSLKRRPGWFVALYVVVKLVAIVGGGAASLVCLMSVAGLVTSNLWVRLAAAAIVLVVVPTYVARAIRPREDPLLAIGLTTDTYAACLLGFAFVFVLVLQDRTQRLLLAEADGEYRTGVKQLAVVSYWLAGVTPVDPPRK